jgi:hypothetical protein
MDIASRLEALFGGAAGADSPAEFKPYINAQERERAFNVIEQCRLQYLEKPDTEPALLALYLARALNAPLPEWAFNDPEIVKRRDTGIPVIALAQRLFRATKNPMFAFIAYSTSRSHYVLPPEWTQYFDNGLDAFMASFRNSSDGNAEVDAARAFAKAFGIRATVWAGLHDFRVEDEAQSWFLAGAHTLQVIATRAADGKSVNETGAVDTTAADLGLSFSTAWRWWVLFKRAFPELGAIVRVANEAQPELA